MQCDWIGSGQCLVVNPYSLSLFFFFLIYITVLSSSEAFLNLIRSLQDLWWEYKKLLFSVKLVSLKVVHHIQV